MDTQKIFCSACSREVSVLFTDVPSVPGHASLADRELVCLEMGERCTTGICPACNVSPEAMAIRVAKSGMRPDQHAVVRAMCDGCMRENDLMLTRGGYVTCPECGATRRVIRT